VFLGEAAQETVGLSLLGPNACRLKFRVSVTLIFHMKLMILWYQNRCLFSARMSTFAEQSQLAEFCFCGMCMRVCTCLPVHADLSNRSIRRLVSSPVLLFWGDQGPNKDRNATLYRAMAPDQLPRESAACGICLSRGSFSRSHARFRHPDLYLDELRDAVSPCVSVALASERDDTSAVTTRCPIREPSSDHSCSSYSTFK
jgi:hypothetical protein